MPEEGGTELQHPGRQVGDDDHQGVHHNVHPVKILLIIFNHSKSPVYTFPNLT